MKPDASTPRLEEIATLTEIGTVREPIFRLVADLIRMTILGFGARSAA